MQGQNNLKMNIDNLIFALDIGTRNVVGVVGKKNGDNFEVIDYDVVEHPQRAMYDGQIHDIGKVVDVVRIVKNNLESRLKHELKYVSIAAAGRALKTNRCIIERDVDSTVEIDKSVISALELEGIQKSQNEMIEKDFDNSKYYCVGHSVVKYYLDETEIANLKGHKGSKIGADIISTFLPHTVVDSLYTVVHKCDLEVVNLTLEPIAAISVCIPQKFRLLNLTLIDIGAGTSDIAITKDGSIVSYGMVSVAGDEITEALCSEFLLDFDTAENLKVNLNKKEEHEFCDIVGMSYVMKTDEILDKIDEAIKNLSKKICDSVLELNGKKPSAIFCIGGGSQISRLKEYIALTLELAVERVVLKNVEQLENVSFNNCELIGPEYITPIGIGQCSSNEYEEDFLQIIVNGSPIRIFNNKQISVSDALALIGFNPRKLISRKGRDLIYYINDVKERKAGKYGEVAKILVNKKEASLDTRLKNKDIIEIIDAVNGEDAVLSISDMLKINNIDTSKYEVYLNEQEIEEECFIKDNDKVLVREKIYNDETVFEKEIDVGKKVLKAEASENTRIIVNGKNILISKPQEDVLFIDVFDYIDFDRTRVKGELVLEINGSKANFTDKLYNDDKVSVYWRN